MGVLEAFVFVRDVTEGSRGVVSIEDAMVCSSGGSGEKDRC